MRKDDVTAELPGVPRRPGRPRSATALDGAARQKLYRERKAAEGKSELPPVFLSADVHAALQAYVVRKNADFVDKPMTLGDAVDRIVRDRLLRPR